MIARGRFWDRKLHAEMGSNASKTAASWRSSRPTDAKIMDALAATPTAFWIGGWNTDVRSTVDGYLDRCGTTSLGVIVAYNIVKRDLGSYSGGGATSASAYRSWIDGVAGGLAGREAIVILEPDALSMLDRMSKTDQAERVSLLTYAVDHLGAAVYVDAGSSNWIPSAEIARRLLLVRAPGFALNTSGTQYTTDECAYGRAIRAVLGPTFGFVVDTGRNGRGPYEPLPGEDPDLSWLNSPGRGIGRRPKLNCSQATNPGLDGLLWVKTPGNSDGKDSLGHPDAGVWQPEEALALYKRAVPAFPPIP